MPSLGPLNILLLLLSPAAAYIAAAVSPDRKNCARVRIVRVCNRPARGSLPTRSIRRRRGTMLLLLIYVHLRPRMFRLLPYYHLEQCPITAVPNGARNLALLVGKTM